MPKGRTLSVSRKKKKKKKFIVNKNGVSFMANKIKRNRTVVSNFIKNSELYSKTKRPGRPPKLTATAKNDDFYERLSKENRALKNFDRNFS